MANILVVDDDPFISRLILLVLSTAGYTAEHLADPFAVIPHITAHPPDLLILDVMLPGISGVDIARLLAHAERTAALPILFLSATDSNDPFLSAALTELHAYHLTKPFGRQTLLHTIEEILGQ